LRRAAAVLRASRKALLEAQLRRERAEGANRAAEGANRAAEGANRAAEGANRAAEGVSPRERNFR
jgi:X-X-X-Leu-X-X-Gly heptad repeat protein